MTLALWQVAVQTASQAVDAAAGAAALRFIGALTAGSFVTGVAMLWRVVRMETILCAPEIGLVSLVRKLRVDFDALKGRVDGALGTSE